MALDYNRSNRIDSGIRLIIPRVNERFAKFDKNHFLSEAFFFFKPHSDIDMTSSVRREGDSYARAPLRPSSVHIKTS